MTAPIGPKLPARSISLYRAEGPSEHLSKTPVEFTGDNPWAQAREQLRAWALTAPANGTVDKTDFTVTYDDEVTYDGTFGLTATDTDLPNHMASYLNHLLAHPTVYGRYTDLDDVRAFLARYEIGR